MAQHGRVLVAEVARRGHVARDAHRHHEVDGRQRVAQASAVGQIAQPEVAPLAAAWVQVAQRVGAGADPIGPMLRELRAASPSLRAFLRDVAGVTSYDDLVALHRRVVGGS